MKHSRPQIIIKLIGLLGKLSYLIIFAVFGGFLGHVCAIAVMSFGAMGVAKLIDPNSIPLSMGWIIALTVGFGILRGLLRFLEQYNNHYIAFKLLAALREKIFHALRGLSPAKLDGKDRGDLIAMITSDVETLEVFYAHTISPVLIALLVDLGVLLFVGLYASWWLAIIPLVAYILIGFVLPAILNKRYAKSGQEYRAEFASFSSFFLSSIKGVREIVLSNSQDNRQEVIRKSSDSLNESHLKIAKQNATAGALMNFFVSLTIIASLLLGLWLAKEGKLTLPVVIVAIVTISSSFGPSLSLGNLPANLTQTFASGDRILSLMEEESTISENESGKDFSFKEASLNEVDFSFGDQAILKDAELKVKEGDFAAILGESGSGKSTTLKLFLHYYDPSKGEVCFNEKPLKEFNPASRKKNVIYMSQDTFIWNDTIRNNLLFAKPEASDEEIWDALKRASLKDFVMSLPAGLDSQAGQLGDALSAGEKQRIGLARALLNNAPLILLDEPTSNIDSINEGIILSSLNEAKDGHTFLIVSHRLSSLVLSSKRYSLKEGGLLLEDSSS